jgi:hypothetical protein
MNFGVLVYQIKIFNSHALFATLHTLKNSSYIAVFVYCVKITVPKTSALKYTFEIHHRRV